VRWARLPEPLGLRPVLLLTRTSAYAYLSKVLAAEVTTHIRGIPQEVALGRKDGLPKRCVAKLDNIHLIPRARSVRCARCSAPHVTSRSSQRSVTRSSGQSLRGSEPVLVRGSPAW
jgi:mRNA-degrading endonuclease toxin of MazEF toxin-antitoxin module